MKHIRCLLIILMLIAGSGCATKSANSVTATSYHENDDPLEPLNRKIFTFNTYANTYVLHPIATGYRKITTKGFRKGFRTFAANVKTPLTIVNDLLQANFKNAGLDLSRFVINSTLGFFGVFDVADRMGIEPNKQGFGTTMAVWGVPSGPYLVLPLLGPSNVRDFSGMLADWGVDPLTYVAANNNRNELATAFWTLNILGPVASYENAMDLLDESQKSALDFYAYMRSMYRQYRRAEIEKAKGVDDVKNQAASYEFSIDDEDEE